MPLTTRRDTGCEEAAWGLVAHYGIATPSAQRPEAPEGLRLVCGPDGLSLVAHGPRGEALALYLDFVHGRQGYRLAHAMQSREELVRALGHLPQDARILDASGGLGRDSLVLAARGFQVTVLERHPVLAALLADALRRAHSHEPLHSTLKRIEFVHADARAWLEGRESDFDAAVFDPMFPARAKDAAVKKEMRTLQQLLGPDADTDAPSTLDCLRRHVHRRVVVKRPLHAPTLGDHAPAYALRGRSTRFDAYLPVGR
jgi:16S rRNA (guanine1516-N2)-methyltransferase